MLESGLVPHSVATYLTVSRGGGSEYLRYPTDRLSRFFGDCLESLEASGLSARHVKLSVVDSHRLDIETLISSDQHRVVFDQSLADAFRLGSAALLDEMYPFGAWVFPEEIDRTPSLLHALTANRFLAIGMEQEALIQAHLSRMAGHTGAAARFDADHLNRWVDVQCAFAVAHEVGHCRLLGSGESLARGAVQSFEDLMLPYVREMDTIDPAEYAPGFLDEGLGRDLRARASALEIPLSLPQFRGTSREERLDWIVSESDGIGEEVLCDFISLSFTARMPQGRLAYDECLIACVSAFGQLALIRYIEQVCLSFSGRKIDSAETDRLARELSLRSEFMGYSAVLLLGKQHARESHALGLSLEEYGKTYNDRAARLLQRLNLIRSFSQALTVRLILSFPASTTEQIKRSLLTSHPDLFDAIGTDMFPALLGELTGIGKGLSGIEREG